MFSIQRRLIVVLCLCLWAENEKFEMFRSTNDIGELYTCTRCSVLLIGERITANTQKRFELCKCKVGQVPELVKVLS
jgi:hypothetical protein